TVRLAAGGAGNRVEIDNTIDWKTPATALKATFPLTASNPKATYNWDVGTILSDCKYGSDKPDDNTLRLTLVYTPGLGEGNGRSYSDQTTLDWGRHRFIYGLASHA